MKQYATIRLSDLEIVKQAKSKAALEGVSLLEWIEQAIKDRLAKS